MGASLIPDGAPAGTHVLLHYATGPAPTVPGSNFATLQQILDTEFSPNVGQFPVRGVGGWTANAGLSFKNMPITGVAATTGGALGSFTPKEGLPIIILHTVLYVNVNSTGAATVSVGTAATATTSSANLITSADVGTAPSVVYDNITDIGASGKSRQLMLPGQFLTITGSASTVGLTGMLYFVFIKI
jgi:hypothetical protein